MKILAVYEGITGLFPKKILVTLIHALNGNTISTHKMSVEHLPDIFNRPTILDLGEQSWRITKAIPFQLEGTKKLTLHVIEPTTPFDKFMVPTISVPLPVFTENANGGFAIVMAPEDWRQLELLPVAQLELIQEEMIVIEERLSAMEEDAGLLGYDTIHERIRIEDVYLNIPFDEFFQFVNGQQKGSVHLVPDSFVICSENYHYYGIVKDGIILSLCLQQFESAEDEFAGVVEKYELLLADWCSAKIIF